MVKTKIIFLVLQHTHLMDLAGPDQVFLEAIDYGTPLQIEYCAAEERLQTSAGLPLGKLKNFADTRIGRGDFLFIPGADLNYIQSQLFKNKKSLFEWIRKCRKDGVIICSICSGAFVLGHAGLLHGRICTTHWKRTGELQKLYPTAKVMDNILFTEDDGIFTSAGIASGIDLALYILEQMKGSYIAHKVAREMVIYNRRAGMDKQQSDLLNFRNHIHSAIHKAQDWLHDNLHSSPSISSLAAIVNMSERNFTRIFKRETSVTVNHYISMLRREKITNLLKSPDLSRKQIANACGLKSERHVSRLLKGAQ